MPSKAAPRAGEKVRVTLGLPARGTRPMMEDRMLEAGEGPVNPGAHSQQADPPEDPTHRSATVLARDPAEMVFACPRCCTNHVDPSIDSVMEEPENPIVVARSGGDVENLVVVGLQVLADGGGRVRPSWTGFGAEAVPDDM